MLQNTAARGWGRGSGLPNSAESHSICERRPLAAGHRSWSHYRYCTLSHAGLAPVLGGIMGQLGVWKGQVPEGGLEGMR